ncbi:hypothetical protein ACHAPJ_007412 [Fusarium lateritium]
MSNKAVTLPRFLPDPAQWDRLIEQYKAFRLLSLELSPESFGSTYAREVAFPKETWDSRLKNPLAFNTVVVSDPEPGSANDLTLILNSPWLASLVLSGPLEAKTAAKVWEDQMQFDPGTTYFGPPAPGIEWTYVLNAIYVPPSERRKGLANKLIENAKRLAVEDNNGNKVMLVLLVNFDLVAARKCYEKSGFELIYDYWYNDGSSTKGHAAVMRLDIGADEL